MKFASWSEDDYITEVRTLARLRRLERRAEMKAKYHDKNGEIVHYLPTEYGYLVTSGGERLGELRRVA